MLMAFAEAVSFFIHSFEKRSSPNVKISAPKGECDSHTCMMSSFQKPEKTVIRTCVYSSSKKMNAHQENLYSNL